MKKYVLMVLAVVFLVGHSFADTYSTGATSAQFLKIGIGTRQTSMGSAYAGVADDVDTIYWNNGGLGFIESKGVSFTSLQWFVDITMTSLAYVHPLGEGSGVIGVGYVQETVPDMEGRTTDTPEPEWIFSENNSMIALSYGKAFEELGDTLFGFLDDSCEFSGGMTLKIISLKIDEDSTSGYAADIGTLCKLEDSGVNIGFTIQNLGPEMAFIEESFQLPTIGKLGVAYNELLDGDLLLAMDMNFPNDYGPITVALGGEYSKEVSEDFDIAARAGYDTTTDLSGFCLGIGMVYKQNFGLDIGYAPQGELGNGIRISLSGKF